MLPIDLYVHRKIIILHQSTSVSETARVMCDENVGCVLVSDVQESLVGIVTDRDLACSVTKKPEWLDLSISEVMTPRPVSVEKTADLEQVIHLMEESGIRRVPVVEITANGGSTCIGIVTLDDLITSKMIDTDHLARVVRAQIRRRWVKHPFSKSAFSLNHFYLTISERVDIPAGLLVDVTQFLLGCLVRRLHYAAATRFAVQLPPAIQEELLDLPSGPNRNVDQSLMISELVSRFGFSGVQAESVVRNFFPVLWELVEPSEIVNVMGQLPGEFRALFYSKSVEAA